MLLFNIWNIPKKFDWEYYLLEDDTTVSRARESLIKFFLK